MLVDGTTGADEGKRGLLFHNKSILDSSVSAQCEFDLAVCIFLVVSLRDSH